MEKVLVTIDEQTIAGDSPGTVIDPVWWMTTIYDGQKAYEESLKAFSHAQRLMLAMLWFDAEVNNGGHDQFYSNSTGIVWKDALEGFETVGLVEVASGIEESIKRIGTEPSLDRDERNAQLAAACADFDDLDDRYYAMNREMDFNEVWMRFIRSCPDDFLFSGLVLKPPPIRFDPI